MAALHRMRRAFWGIRQEVLWAFDDVVDGRWGYIANVLAYRALAIWPRLPGAGKLCRLTTRGGSVINYRRDRGDLQGIREIFIDEIYRLPEDAQPVSLVDLGANIGLATIWLSRNYRIERICVVEPLSTNVSVLMRNLRDNGVVASVVRKAIGSNSGTITFSTGTPTNMGRVSESGLEVDVVTLSQLLEESSVCPSLLKMDIEGAEAQLIFDDTSETLKLFDIVVTELHPEFVNVGAVTRRFAEWGFDYLEPVEVNAGARRSKRERVFAKSNLGLSR